jgi:hypothetical protein
MLGMLEVLVQYWVLLLGKESVFKFLVVWANFRNSTVIGQQKDYLLLGGFKGGGDHGANNGNGLLEFRAPWADCLVGFLFTALRLYWGYIMPTDTLLVSFLLL